MSVEQVLTALGSSRNGLVEAEAAQRLARTGPNEIARPKEVSRLRMLLSEFANPLILILIASGGLLLVASALDPEEGHRADALLIFAIVLINAALSYAQNYRAHKGIEALQRVASPSAILVRARYRATVHARVLVPGDIVMLEEGHRVPADGRLIAVSAMQVDESPLTGESLAVSKTTDAVAQEAALAERRSSVYSGTTVVTGRGTFVVTGTGMSTELGKIAEAVEALQEGETSFQREIAALGKRITLIVGVLIALVAVVQLAVVSQSLLDTFIVVVALSVAAIPEGLPVVLTLALAFGTRRMLERNALVSSLPVVEIIGSAQTICIDKTGTITEGLMSLRRLSIDGRLIEVTGGATNLEGEFLLDGSAIDLSEGLAMQAAGLCNNAHRNEDGSLVGDPTETALLIGAMKAGVRLDSFVRVLERPFSSARRMMSVVVERTGQQTLFAKGAPETIVDCSLRTTVAGETRALTGADRERLLSLSTDLASQGYRVLGLAQKEGPAQDGDWTEDDLVFIGLAAISDPPREGVRTAIEQCERAGIRIVMITGDAKPTAIAIAKEVGLSGEALTGRDLDDMDEAAFGQAVRDVSLFARAEPRHKVRILDSLQVGDSVVVMTGDGVNDAPALKAADVGIAMGIRGTDVARSASDMVLLDDSFPTIVAAIEEGRRIFANIKKFVNYLLIGNFAEVVVILVAGVFGYLPVTAVQILWINLVTDSGPAVALGVDPVTPGLMDAPPRRGQVIGKSMMVLLGGIGAVKATIILATFALGLRLYDLETAQTMVFTAFVVQEYLRLAVIRFQERTSFFVNRWLISSVALSLALQLGIVYSPAQAWFGVTALGLVPWAVLLGGLVIGFGAAVAVTSAVVSRYGRP